MTAIDWSIKSEHALVDLTTFTQRVAGWRRLPAGGQVPVHEPVTPYVRWYCACGAIGGRQPDAPAALNDHARHADEREAES